MDLKIGPKPRKLCLFFGPDTLGLEKSGSLDNPDSDDNSNEPCETSVLETTSEVKVEHIEDDDFPNNSEESLFESGNSEASGSAAFPANEEKEEFEAEHFENYSDDISEPPEYGEEYDESLNNSPAVKPYICEHIVNGAPCGKRYAENRHLTRHLRYGHQTVESKYKCEIIVNVGGHLRGQRCGKTFETKAQFVSHIKEHPKDKQYICDRIVDGVPCGKAFRYSR